MTIKSYQRLTAILIAILIVLVSLLVLLFGWLVCRCGWQSIEIGFADEQTGIFEDMTTQALQSNTRQAVDCLQYVVEYYPSGTKQRTGSHLDLIVERQRRQAIREIIAYLRKKTGEDLGSAPEDWIKKFGTNSLRSDPGKKDQEK